MASPQCEDGYTKIANDIMDALVRFRIPGEERQVLDCIIRKTYGWGKKTDRISLSQFCEATGMKKPNVVRSIHSLLSKMIIVVIKSDNDSSHVYGINKDYDQWKPLSKKITLSKVITPIIKSDNESLSKVIPTKEKKETITKEKTPLPPKPKTQNPKIEPFSPPDWVDTETWKAFEDHRKAIKKPMTDQAKKLIIAKLGKFQKAGHFHVDVLNQSIENGWQGIFEIKDKNGNQLKTVEQELAERGAGYINYNDPRSYRQ